MYLIDIKGFIYDMGIETATFGYINHIRTCMYKKNVTYDMS